MKTVSILGSLVVSVAMALWFVDAGASAQPEGKAKLGQEQKLPNEEKIIKDLVDVQVDFMKATDPTKRGQHPKHHGCVEADFVVLGNLPQQLRRGIFAEAKPYKAKIRFSNGASADDTKDDIHGMAIKVFGVDGPRALEKCTLKEQDFILIDSPTFFAKDANEVVGLLKGQLALLKNDRTVMTQFAKDNPKVMIEVGKSKKKLANIPSPLAIPYWSTVPYKLGNGAVKYAVEPAKGNNVLKPLPDVDGKLHKAMAAHLAKKDAEFHFYLVEQTNANDMPIEDATKEWNDKNKVHVATIKIKAQVFDGAKQMKECEDLSFDPWHSLDAHRPLGNINRARKEVYQASSALRHK